MTGERRNERAAGREIRTLVSGRVRWVVQRDDDATRGSPCVERALEELGCCAGSSSAFESRPTSSRSPNSRAHHRAVIPSASSCAPPCPSSTSWLPSTASSSVSLSSTAANGRNTVRAELLRITARIRMVAEEHAARRTGRATPSRAIAAPVASRLRTGVTDVARERKPRAPERAGEQRRNSVASDPPFQCVRWETIWRGYRMHTRTNRDERRPRPASRRTIGDRAVHPSHGSRARIASPVSERRSDACASW